MPKARTGGVSKRKDGWYARVDYIVPGERNAKGEPKRRTIARKCRSESEARRVAAQLAREFENSGEQQLKRDTASFAHFAEVFRRRYVVPPVYVDGVKVSGRRSWQHVSSLVDAPKEYFGNRRLISITYGDLEAFRAHRIATPTRYNTPRKLSTVNKEMGFLRRMFTVAVRDGLIPKNPFAFGDPLVRPGDELPKTRTLTREEEARLLAACDTPTRRELRSFVILLLDTGMRRNEAIQLLWTDVDLAAGLVEIRAFNTKTMRGRTVGLTPRAKRELVRLSQGEPNADGRVFSFYDPRTSFKNTLKDAEISGVTLHTFRHTAATRAVAAGVPIAEIALALGHTRLDTTMRYTNPTVDSVRRFAAALAGDEEDERQGATPAERVN